MRELNKKAGVCYAFTSDGVELPVVDVSHPAFMLRVTDPEQRQLVEAFLKEGPPLHKLPSVVRNLLLRFFLRGSVLADGIRRSRGRFMSGLHTYLFKLGPEMLGNAYAKPIDRKIAASLPVLGVRLRLQDVAHLMADILAPVLLADRRQPLRFVNIGGGPAMDSVNALILIHKDQPGVLSQREVAIDVLDLDDEGPAFGQNALNALVGPGGPLQGLQVTFRHVRYNWADTAHLESALREAHSDGSLIMCSSEGGLFEYGSDSEIVTNLRVLRPFAEVLAVVGSVTRADEPIQCLQRTSPALTRPRGLDVFRTLVQQAGWDVSRAVERPFSDQVVLR